MGNIKLIKVMLISNLLVDMVSANGAIGTFKLLQ